MDALRMGDTAAALSLTLAIGASAALALLPTGSKTVAVRADEPVSEVTHESLLEHEGGSVLVVLAVPVLAAALGAVTAPGHRRARIVSAVLVWAFSILGAASIGLFYVPAALAMTVAARRSRLLG
ncbi:MAG TPA: hypothetical protein VHH09_02475, partial [Acidimicrobiales bacterium]|nr:hypothetical protein [Acidimicrobiales bacterium]